MSLVEVSLSECFLAFSSGSDKWAVSVKQPYKMQVQNPKSDRMRFMLEHGYKKMKPVLFHFDALFKLYRIMYVTYISF